MEIIETRVRALSFRTGDYRYFRWCGFSPLRSFGSAISYRHGLPSTRQRLVDEAEGQRLG
jgi:hypothetical protein